MTAATTTSRSPSATRSRHWLPVGFASVAAVASLAAAVGGGTLARGALAVALPMAVGIWIHVVKPGRPPATVLAVLGLLAVAGTLHVAFTSSTAAWVVDSHMAPPDLLPGGTARIAVAWTVPLLWTAAFVAMAVAHLRVANPVGSVALLAVGVAPLLFGNAFPTDAYRLLWDSTALGHPLYAAGACTVLGAMLTHARASQRPPRDWGPP